MATHPKLSFHFLGHHGNPSVATHPKLSFHNSGISGNPSKVVTPQFWHQWHPIPSCHTKILALNNISSSVVIPT
eukprot:1304191-Amphidinium_carterae.1